MTDRAHESTSPSFILVALYTGTRAGAVCGAALRPSVGRGWIDLDRGIFYGAPAGVGRRKSGGRPSPCPGECWRICGAGSARSAIRRRVEWQPVKDVDKAFARTVGKPGFDESPRSFAAHGRDLADAAGTDLWEAAGYLGMTVEMLARALRPPSSRPPERRHGTIRPRHRLAKEKPQRNTNKRHQT